jgi:hypothetical protein
MNYLQEYKGWRSQEQIRKDLNIGTESELLSALDSLRRRELVERRARGEIEWRMKRAQ